MAELAEILRRRKFEKKIAASGCSAAQLAERYTALAVPVRPIALAGISLNPDEDIAIGTALAAHTELIVTGDHPLLTVGQYRSVRLVKVAQTLALIPAQPRSQPQRRTRDAVRALWVLDDQEVNLTPCITVAR